MNQKYIIYILTAALRAAREFNENHNHKPKKNGVQNPCQPATLNHAVFEILKGNPHRNRTTKWIAKRVDDEDLFDFHTDTPAANVVALLKRSVKAGEEYFPYIISTSTRT